MACGRVTLSSDAGGIRDLVRQGETGFMVSRHELDRLGEALSEVLSLPQDERAGMGARARTHVQQAHAPERECEAYRAIYEGLVRR